MASQFRDGTRVVPSEDLKHVNGVVVSAGSGSSEKSVAAGATDVIGSDCARVIDRGADAQLTSSPSGRLLVDGPLFGGLVVVDDDRPTCWPVESLADPRSFGGGLDIDPYAAGTPATTKGW